MDAATICQSAPVVDPMQYKSSIGHVAKVARQVVAAVVAHNIKLTTKNEFSFYAHRLTSSEYDWWKGLTSTEKVSEMLRLRVEKAEPWTPLYPMSAQLQSRLDDPAAKARCKTALEKYKRKTTSASPRVLNDFLRGKQMACRQTWGLFTPPTLPMTPQ